MTNYRPVSQGSIPCLILEKIVAASITDDLTRNELFDENQHGSVPRKSTCSQLLVMSQEYAEFINSKTPFHAIYFDLKAAFDKVNYSLLLTKMTRSDSPLRE